MNTKRILFWTVFVAILGLIVWGLAVAMKKPLPDANIGQPAPITTADHVTGPENAPVTIIEYSDFECPACESYYHIVDRLLEEASTTVRLIYRHFPLSQHKHAVPAAMASEAAGAQGKFWEMYDMIFSNYREWVDLSVVEAEGKFAGYAAELGLDGILFKADTASSTLRTKVNDDMNDAIRIGVNATPTFFVDGKVITNPGSYEQFKAIIDEAAAGN